MQTRIDIFTRSLFAITMQPLARVENSKKTTEGPNPAIYTFVAHKINFLLLGCLILISCNFKHMFDFSTSVYYEWR